MSHNRSPQQLVADAERAAVSAFMFHVLGVAQAIDPRLVRILTGEAAADGPGGQGELRWAGGRRKGLELCLAMLAYARPDAEPTLDAARIEAGIEYIRRELARLP